MGKLFSAVSIGILAYIAFKVISWVVSAFIVVAFIGVVAYYYYGKSKKGTMGVQKAKKNKPSMKKDLPYLHDRRERKGANREIHTDWEVGPTDVLEEALPLALEMGAYAGHDESIGIHHIDDEEVHRIDSNCVPERDTDKLESNQSCSTSSYLAGDSDYGSSSYSDSGSDSSND